MNQIVKKLLGFLMTWSNPCLCAALCFYVLDGDAAYKDAGYEAIYPSLFVFLCAYVIAANVATVYGCSIDTILVCSIKVWMPPLLLLLHHLHHHHRCRRPFP